MGLPGVIYTPASGLGLPAVAFGHGYLQPVARYSGLFEYLASWGFVVVAPDSQRGPLPSHRLLAADLRTALDVVAGVKLGDGQVTVNATKLGVAGHGVGASAAVLAAAEDPRVKAVATLAFADSFPSALEVAPLIRVPSLHLAAGNDLLAPSEGHAEQLNAAWGGPSEYEYLKKATHLSFAEGRHWSDLLLPGKSNRKVNKSTNARLAAFFLATL